jgi:uncharacterized protein YunC (DUF1805 family)
LKCQKLEDPKGYPDWTYPVSVTAIEIESVAVDIKAQSIGNLKVDIAAQSLPTIGVDIKAQTVGNLNVNIASQTVGNIKVDLAAQSLATIGVDIKGQTIGNLAVDIKAQSVGNLNVNIAAQTVNVKIINPTDAAGNPIPLKIDISAQSLATLGVDIKAQTVGNLKVDLAAQSLATIGVDIKAQTVGNLNVNIAAQSLSTVGVDIKAQSLRNINVAIASSAVTLNVNLTNPAVSVGQVKPALAFDGVNDYVSFGDVLDMAGTQAFTVVLRAYLTPYTGSWRRILSKEVYDALVRQGWDILHNASGNLIYFERWRDDATDDVRVSYTPGWHVIIARYDGSTIYLRLDKGTDAKAASTKSLIDHTNPLTLGCQSVIANFADCIVSHLLIWTRALSDDEALKIVDNLNSPPTKNLALWCKIDEGTGTTLKDSSPNGYNGTIYGATWVSEEGSVSSTVNVNITGQQIGSLNVNIGSVSSGVTFNVAQSGSWTVNAAQSGTWTINIGAPLDASGNLKTSIQSSVRLDVNIANSAVTLNVNIASISSGVVFNVAQSGSWTINAAQSGTWTINIGGPTDTAGNVKVNIAAQVSNLTIDIKTQSVGIYLEPQWAAKTGTDFNVVKAVTMTGDGCSLYTTDAVPAGKQLQIHLAWIATNQPDNKHLLLGLDDYNPSTGTYTPIFGGSGYHGGHFVFTKPLVIPAGHAVRLVACIAGTTYNAVLYYGLNGELVPV